MLPIRINVLSQSKKVYLKRLTLFSYLKNSCAIIFVVICVFATLLIIINTYFSEYKINLRNYAVSQHPSYIQDIKKIDALNTELTTVSGIQKDYVLLTPTLDTLLSSVPEGTELDSIAIEGKEVALSGVSATRETLVLFETSLTLSPLFSSIQLLPSSDLGRKEDIQFTFKGTLK